MFSFFAIFLMKSSWIHKDNKPQIYQSFLWYSSLQLTSLILICFVITPIHTFINVHEPGNLELFNYDMQSTFRWGCVRKTLVSQGHNDSYRLLAVTKND